MFDMDIKINVFFFYHLYIKVTNLVIWLTIQPGTESAKNSMHISMQYKDNRGRKFLYKIQLYGKHRFNNEKKRLDQGRV